MNNIENIKQFILAIQEHYEAEYKSDLELKFIQTYLQEKDLQWLFIETIKTHSKKWKSLPDVAIFNDIIKEKRQIAIERDAETAWQSILHISNGDNVLIHDTFVFQVVNCYGSWYRFCEERDHNREWTHKDFLRRYNDVRTWNQNIAPKVLTGEKAQLGYEIGVATINIGTGPTQISQDKTPDGLLNFIKRVPEEIQ
jgi:hypothetical protein